MTLKSAKNWTRNQRRFMLWLASDQNTRVPPTQLTFAKEIGVHHVTLSKWKKLDGFLAEVNDIAREMFRDNLPQIYAAIAREAIKGSYQHARLALELIGDVGQGSEQAAGVLRIIIEREGPSSVPPHLSRQSGNGHQPDETIQRSGVWPAVGKDNNGAGPGN